MAKNRVWYQLDLNGPEPVVTIRQSGNGLHGAAIAGSATGGRKALKDLLAAVAECNGQIDKRYGRGISGVLPNSTEEK